jgi:hypothetical protein
MNGMIIGKQTEMRRKNVEIVKETKEMAEEKTNKHFGRILARPDRRGMEKPKHTSVSDGIFR